MPPATYFARIGAIWSPLSPERSKVVQGCFRDLLAWINYLAVASFAAKGSGFHFLQNNLESLYCPAEDGR